MENLSINIKEKKDYFISLFEDTGWDIIKDSVNSSQFDDIIVKLVNEVSQGRRFTPMYKDIFNAFLECPYEKMNVVIVGQDPYPQLGVADGISFSCSKKDKIEKSLNYIFDEIVKTVYTPMVGEEKSKLLKEGLNPDLKRWSKQGILMLNTALTVQIGKIGSHYNVWDGFINNIFKDLNKRSDLIIVLLGKKAEQYELMLTNNTVFKVSHPASAAYRGGSWDSKDVFNKINEQLKLQGKSTIIW